MYMTIINNVIHHKLKHQNWAILQVFSQIHRNFTYYPFTQYHGRQTLPPSQQHQRPHPTAMRKHVYACTHMHTHTRTHTHTHTHTQAHTHRHTPRSLIFFVAPKHGLLQILKKGGLFDLQRNTIILECRCVII